MRLILSLAAAALVPTLATAQSRTAWNFFLGSTSGELLPSTAPSNAKVKGVTAGVTMAVPISSSAAIEMGGALVQRGGHLQGTGMRMEYFEAPVSLRISDETVTRGLRPFVRIGVATSIRTRCERLESPFFTLGQQVPTSSSLVLPEDPCSGLRNRGLDAGPLAGVGLLWLSGISRFTLEARRTDGRSMAATVGNVRVKLSTISVLAGMGFAY